MHEGAQGREGAWGVEGAEGEHGGVKGQAESEPSYRETAGGLSCLCSFTPTQERTYQQLTAITS